MQTTKRSPMFRAVGSHSTSLPFGMGLSPAMLVQRSLPEISQILKSLEVGRE